MARSERFSWQGLTLVIILVVLAGAVRLWPLHALGAGVTYITFYPAVILAALYGGLITGLLAVLLSCLSILLFGEAFFGEPITKDFAGLLGMAVFALTCAAMSGIVEAMRCSHAKVAQVQADLERNNAELRAVRSGLENEIRARTQELTETNADLETELAERTRTENALRESEERFRLFMNNSPNIAWMKDERGRYVYMNQAYENRMGVRLADCHGRTGFDLWPPQLAQQYWRTDQEVLSSDQQIQFTEKRVNFDGTVTWWWKFKFPFADSFGTKYVAGIGVDVTERKEAEDATREIAVILESRVKERTAELESAKEAISAERQRLYDVLETLPVYVCLLDKDYRMPFANRYFRDTFGYSASHPCHKFLFDRTEPCETCETYTVLKTIAPHHWYWTGPNGRDYDIYDFPFIDSDGALMILEMGIDITERKQAESALKQTLDDLIRSNADLEHFAYIASHDLQEPLRNVTSTLQMLEKRHKGQLTEDADQLIQYAVGSAKRMKDLIADLLKYSRLATRSQALALVDIEHVVDESIRNLKSLIEKKGTVITRDKMPEVVGDPTQLVQLFQNLIANAIKFGPAESPKVHVSASLVDGEWVFGVADNGIGIDNRYFDRIFVIFQQLNKRGLYGGTGMGLAIVKKIVERHRGRVWLESGVGSGTTFYVALPSGSAS